MKKKNKRQKNAEQPEVKILYTINVDVLSSGQVQVRGFPNIMEQALQVLAMAMIVLAKYFRKQSDDKNLGRIIQLNKQQVAQANKAFLQ